MTKAQTTLDRIKNWWNALDRFKHNNNLPAKGTVAGALVVLDRLMVDYVLDINHHKTKKGKSQIIGLGRAKVRKILSRFGETREFSIEGGRTNRGLAGDIENLLNALKLAELHSLPANTRNDVIVEIQKFLVGKVAEYFSRKRVKFAYSTANTAWQSVHGILEAARKVGKEGPVAQYLVGAKLALRFPEFNIRNDISSAQDEVSGSPGDFLVNDTVFHVTVAPNPGHFDKCKQNLSDSYSVYLLVPDRVLSKTIGTAEVLLSGQATTLSIESFVAQNLEELSSFSRGELVTGFRRFLEKYNEE